MLLLSMIMVGAVGAATNQQPTSTPTPTPTPLLTPTVTPTTIGSSNVALSSVGGIASGGRRDANLMIDGITTGYTGSLGYAVAPVNIPMTITLNQVYTIDRIRILLWDLDNRYYRYYVQTSTDNSIWTTVIDRTSGQWQSWQDVTFAPINVKYIRIVGTFNSVNTDYNIVELEAYSSSLTPTSTPTPTPSPTPSSTGKNYYMSPSGSDSNSGTISSPWKTVGFASSKLKPGDTLYARGGTYTGQYGWNSPSGTSLAPITWKAYPGETPIFDGQGSAAGNFINIVGLDWLIFDGITIKNYKSIAGIWIGYSGSGTDWAEHDTFRNLKFYDMGNDPSLEHALYASYGTRDIEISNSMFFRTSGAALHFYHSPGVVGAKIYNNLIDGGGIATWGMVLRDGATDLEIYNNIIVNNTYDIDFIGSINSIVRNNILSKPFSFPKGAGSITASNNMFLSGTPNDGSSSSFVGNARFVNPSIGDYHLQSSSDAINRGITIPLVTTDLDGNVRPDGLAYDIGAYEYR